MELYKRKEKDQTFYYDFLIDALSVYLPPDLSFVVVDFLPFCVHENCTDTFHSSFLVGDCDSTIQCELHENHQYCKCCATRCCMCHKLIMLFGYVCDPCHRDQSQCESCQQSFFCHDCFTNDFMICISCKQ